jgi:hypothetical protein
VPNEVDANDFDNEVFSVVHQRDDPTLVAEGSLCLEQVPGRDLGVQAQRSCHEGHELFSACALFKGHTDHLHHRP